MPTYEYSCDHCGHHFERFQSMKDDPVKRCPECRHKVRRLLGTGAGIIFKGSGFYETDYKRSGSRPSENASKSEGKSDTKSGSDSSSKTTTASESAK